MRSSSGPEMCLRTRPSEDFVLLTLSPDITVMDAVRAVVDSGWELAWCRMPNRD